MYDLDRSHPLLFSNLGPRRDGRPKPELLAPGACIWANGDEFPHASSQTVSLIGTSFATPIVTGTVAGLLQADPTLDGTDTRTILETPPPLGAPVAPLGPELRGDSASAGLADRLAQQ
jgi:subtilisin family serine protease